MNCTIRPMCKEDIEPVTKIDREVFSTQWPPANYKQELQNRLARYLVACNDQAIDEAPVTMTTREHNNGIISRLMQWFKLRPLPDTQSPDFGEQSIIGFAGIWVLADEAHITNIAVRKKCQRQGIGELLLIHTIELAKKLGADTLTLEVRVSNAAAQNLYLKYGFTQVGLRRAYYTDNREDGMLMSTENIHSDSYQALFQQLKQGYQKRWYSQPPVS